MDDVDEKRMVHTADLIGSNIRQSGAWLYPTRSVVDNRRPRASARWMTHTEYIWDPMSQPILLTVGGG